MAKISIFNIGKANAEINSGHEAADTALASAKITSLKVDGKDVAATDAPLAVKIAAVASLAASGEKTQDVSELIASNGQIASQLDKATNDLVAEKAISAGHAQKISSLESELATSKSSVSTLTADLTGAKNLLTASNDLNAKLTTAANAVNTEISKQCIAVNCLTLTDGDGKPLAKEATEDQKIEAANKIPVAEKITALMGAVNSAAASVGVNLKSVPAVSGATSTGTDNGKKLTADAQIAKALAAKK